MNFTRDCAAFKPSWEIQACELLVSHVVCGDRKKHIDTQPLRRKDVRETVYLKSDNCKRLWYKKPQSIGAIIFLKKSIEQK